MKHMSKRVPEKNIDLHDLVNEPSSIKVWYDKYFKQ
jgi:hypothetical protein